MLRATLSSCAILCRSSLSWSKESQVSTTLPSSGENRKMVTALTSTSLPVGAMRAAVPRFAHLDFSDFTEMRAVGVTPEYARALVAAGFPSISADELVEARAVGVTGD